MVKNQSGMTFVIATHRTFATSFFNKRLLSLSKLFVYAFFATGLALA